MSDGTNWRQLALSVLVFAAILVLALVVLVNTSTTPRDVKNKLDSEVIPSLQRIEKSLGIESDEEPRN